MNILLLPDFARQLISMSTVKICRIKLPRQSTSAGIKFPWRGAAHSPSESLYLPDPENGKTLIINTENEKVTGAVEGTGKNSTATVCVDRGLLFLAGSGEKRGLIHKIGNGKNLVPLDFEFPPERISLDSDRNIMLVSGERYYFCRYPDGKNIEFSHIPGKPIDTYFDDLEDAFVLLLGDPSRLLMILPGETLTISHDISFGDETVSAAVICSVEKKILAGTESGKILTSDLDGGNRSVVAVFREPVSKIIFNGLMNHLYVMFRNSRNLAVVDMQNGKVREVEKCSAEISDIMFDELHNKIYALLPSVSALEVYLDMGR